MMKNQKSVYSFLLIISFLISAPLLGKSLEEKRKTIEKSYPVGDNIGFQVENMFGKVHINSWEKREISVKVEIITTGRNEEKAQKMMDMINVIIDKGSSQISFQTKLASNMNNNGDNSFEINYTVNMPSINPLFVKNKFGDTFIATRDGISDVEVSYGKLKAEDFNNDLDLELSFGEGKVGRTKNSKIEVKYSQLSITSGEEMDMEQKFSEVSLREVNVLELESKYGEMDLGKVGILDADAQFSGFSIDELSGSLYMEASYVSGFEIRLLKKTFTSVEIYGKFSGYEIRLEEGLKANLEAEFSFANLEASENIDMYYQIKDGNRSEYKGRIGGGDPQKKITVKSSYGDLKIR